MAKIKVKLQDTTPARVVFLDPKATEGATLGTNVFLPDGTVGTPATIKTYLGITTAPAIVNSGNAVHHHLLQGLTEGDDHPQYLRKDTLTTEGDLYVRGELTVERLGVGAEGEVLKVVAGIPAWATDEQGVIEVIGTYGEIDVNNYDPSAPVISLAPEVIAALMLAESAVQPGDLATVAFTGDYADLINTPPDISDLTYITANDETADLINSRRLVAGSNIAFDTSTPGQFVINASGGGGSGVVEAVIGTPYEIDVDDYDPAFPIISLADEVIASLILANSALQPGDAVSLLTNDVPYLVASDLTGYVPTSRQIISGAGLTGGGDLSADRTLAVGAGTGITVNADDVQISAAYQTLINGAIQSSVLTTNGDLLTRAAGVPARIAAGTDGFVLTMVSGAPAWAAGGGGASGANPTASVGLSAVNGVATTFMRSDAAPPLDVGISPTWTSLHVFNNDTPIRLDGGLTGFPASAGGAYVYRLGAITSPAGFSNSAGHLVLVPRSNSTAAFGVLIAAGENGVNQAFTFGVRPGVVQVIGDSTELRLGATDDFALYHDGSNNYISSRTGNLVLLDSSANTCLTASSASITLPTGAPSLKIGGAFTGVGSGGSTSLGFYINDSSSAARVMLLQAGFTRMTGTSDATQPSSRYSHYTTDMSTERGYWGYPTTSSDTMILRNIAGTVLQFRLAANSTRLQIDDTTGVVYNAPVNYTGSVTPEVGFRVVPQNVQNGNYTAVLGDSGCHIYKASGGAGETFTIPPNGGAGAVAYPIGTMLTFVNDGGGTLSIAITTDTLEMSPGGATGTRTLADNGVATALKVTSTVWKIWGTGLT